MQTDPIGYADGLNWYAYVGNDPVNKTDPLGLMGEDDKIFVDALLDRPDISEDELRFEFLKLDFDLADLANTIVVRPTIEAVRKALSFTPDSLQGVGAGGQVGLGLVIGSEGGFAIEDDGRVSLNYTWTIGAGIAGGIWAGSLRA